MIVGCYRIASSPPVLIGFRDVFEENNRPVWRANGKGAEDATITPSSDRVLVHVLYSLFN